MPTSTYDVQIDDKESTLRVSVVNKGTPTVLPPGTNRDNLKDVIRAVFRTPEFFDIAVNEINGVNT